MSHPHIRSFSALAIVTLVVSSFVSVLFATPAHASDICTVSTDALINNSYITSNSCGDGITITGTHTITWSGTLSAFNSGATIDVNGNPTFVGAVTLDASNNTNFTVESGKTVNAQAEDFTGVQVLNANVIDIEGSIDVSGLGCQHPSLVTDGDNGKGPSGGICTIGGSGASSAWFTGGAHCGYGGKNGFGGSNNMGVYESSSTPALPGASGGGWNGYYFGSAAGGVVRLTAVNIVIYGTVSAVGAHGSCNSQNGAGAGAGGTIYLDASDSITGSGAVTADGGSADVGGTGGCSQNDHGYGGGGGAGYIAAYYVNGSIGPTLSAAGGSGSNPGVNNGGSCYAYTHKNSGGAPIPEFASWVLIATMLTGFGLAYKLMPKLSARTLK